MKKRLIFGAVFSAAVVFSVFYIALNADYSAIPVYNETSGAYTLIIDAGHGGLDGGAVSVTGRYESEINLEIAKRCKIIAEFLGYTPVMTRESNEIIYPDSADTIREKKVADTRSRVELINSCENAFLISIHQNKYTSPSPSGAQVFYKGDTEKIAAEMQNYFVTCVNPDKKRTPAKVSGDIYIFAKTNCPGMLVECGFLSNPEEAAKLETGDHQKLISVIIIGSISNYFT